MKSDAANPLLFFLIITMIPIKCQDGLKSTVLPLTMTLDKTQFFGFITRKIMIRFLLRPGLLAPWIFATDRGINPQSPPEKITHIYYI